MKNIRKSILGMATLAVLAGCATQEKEAVLTLSGLNPANFETTIDGTKQTKLYTLKNHKGMEVCITNFGGRRIFQVILVLQSGGMPIALIKER